MSFEIKVMAKRLAAAPTMLASGINGKRWAP